MKLHVTIQQHTYLVETERAISLAIPMQFNGAQPACFGSAPATAEPLRVGNFVGDVAQGGSCNVPVIQINPHCNGTHTESISHIVDELIPPAVHAATMTPCTVVSIKPAVALTTTESYRPDFNNHDTIISAAQLQKLVADVHDVWLQALVIRTLPNETDKRTRDYSDAPFFTREAMRYLVSRGVKHLLVDFPSIDRMNDDGHLTAHHLFWAVEEGAHQLNPQSRRDATVTELIYVPNEVDDGQYLLTLQVPAFALDVAPSRPVLFPLKNH